MELGEDIHVDPPAAETGRGEDGPLATEAQGTSGTGVRLSGEEAVGGARKRARLSEHPLQVITAHAALLEDAEEGAFGEFFVEWDDGAELALLQADVAAFLSHHDEARRLKEPDQLAP